VALYLVGAGLGPGYQGRIVEDLLSRADRVYVESYTVPGAGWLLEYARGIAGDRVVEAGRGVLEEGARAIVEEAARRVVVVLVAGDPLVATTHRSLLVEAARRGVEWRVIPGVSGVCAAKSIAMLDYYKYGRTVTVPGPWRMVRAVSVVEYILANACAGLHTLALLDIDPRSGRQLPPDHAARQLLSFADGPAGTLLSKAPVMVVERAGLQGERVRVLPSLSRLAGLDSEDWGEPASLVLPGRLGRVEREHVEAVYGVDPGPGLQPEEACRALSWLREEAL